jgi:hypothetical protein
MTLLRPSRPQQLVLADRQPAQRGQQRLVLLAGDRDRLGQRRRIGHALGALQIVERRPAAREMAQVSPSSAPTRCR